MPTVHDFRGDILGSTTGRVYDASQTHDEIHDGDVLIAEDEGKVVVAILIEAWPTAVWGSEDKPSSHGAFHVLAAGYSWPSLDRGKYWPSFQAACEWRQQNLDVEMG